MPSAGDGTVPARGHPARHGYTAAVVPASSSTSRRGRPTREATPPRLVRRDVGRPLRRRARPPPPADRRSTLDVFGLGGDRLRAEGGTLVAHVDDLAVVGLLEVLRHLPRLRRRLPRPSLARGRRASARPRRPRRLPRLPPAPRPRAEAPRRCRSCTTSRRRSGRGGAGGSPRSATRSTRMIVIFPFEEALYREAGVHVTFVGHPLVERRRARRRTAPPFSRSTASTRLGPCSPSCPAAGRRRSRTTCPPLAGALPLVAARRPDVQLALAVAPGLPRRARSTALARARRRARRRAAARPARRGARRHRRLGHRHGRGGAARRCRWSSCIASRRSPTRSGGRSCSVPHYAMANLIAGREVVRELIQRDFRPEAVGGRGARPARGRSPPGKRRRRPRRDARAHWGARAPRAARRRPSLRELARPRTK